jgi:S1-C subfamily serine protease
MGCVIVWQDGAVVVTSVNPLGPAAASGQVLVGDHIVEVGGTAVTSVDQARTLILGPGIFPSCSARAACLADTFFSGKQVRAEAQAQHI